MFFLQFLPVWFQELLISDLFEKFLLFFWLFINTSILSTKFQVQSWLNANYW